MNEIEYRDDGVYMRVNVEGREAVRRCEMQNGTLVPELRDGEHLLATIDGKMTIIRVPDYG